MQTENCHWPIADEYVLHSTPFNWMHYLASIDDRKRQRGDLKLTPDNLARCAIHDDWKSYVRCSIL